jgi:hypothetical protein
MHSFQNNYNSKSAHVENGHPKENTRNIIKILHETIKGPHLDTIEKFYIYKETKNGNQLNNKHSWPQCNL